MLDRAQAGPWVDAMLGYITPAYRGFKSLPIWTSDPNITPYRDVLDGARFDGWPGSPGRAAAQATDQFVVIDMYADVCINKMTPQAAMQKAENRLTQIYKA
jgi:multiple sugar transport system substrate-binding protein